MYRIFIVEDDPGIAEGIKRQAEAWGLEVRCADDLRNVMGEFAAFSPHLVLLDITLPFFNGYHWCSAIRAVSKVPIIFISSAADSMNIVMAMSMGADDFIAKPFDGSVLMAKIQALLRRSYDFAPGMPIIEHRGAILNTDDNSLSYNGKSIALTKNEYRILLCLMQSRGKVVSREKLMEKLWETDSFVDENTLTVNVGRLRKKLDAAGLEGFIAASVLAAAIFLASFALYGLPLLAVAYPALLCLVLAAVFAIRDFAQAKRRHAEFMALTEITAAEEKMLPPARSIDDADYRRIIALLAESREKISRSAHRRWSDTLDYYTVWVHQIKTPIASMRLTLEGSDSPESRKLSAELGRIERYVEMALVYLRLDSESSDYVIREFELDPFIRRSVKKFAGEFISKRLSLELEPSGASVVSDEKWLAFVVEQVLSNSLKYTREGSVRIYLAEPKTLCIRDTGIGIAPEDLPRIFDKGYTGLNGRADLRASGLGLYLCRRVCRKLGHEISAVSAPGKGTEIRIDLSSYDLDPE